MGMFPLPFEDELIDEPSSSHSLQPGELYHGQLTEPLVDPFNEEPEASLLSFRGKVHQFKDWLDGIQGMVAYYGDIPLEEW